MTRTEETTAATGELIRHALPFDLSLICPQVPSPRSDKYSRNLHNWLRRYSKQYGAGIWCSQRSHVDGSHKPFAFDRADRADIYVGFHDDAFIIGAQIAVVRCGDFATAAWAGNRHAIDITDWFWREYLVIGRCIFDPEHEGFMTDTDCRFDYPESTVRVCRWCGRREVQRTEQVTSEVTRWHEAALSL